MGSWEVFIGVGKLLIYYNVNHRYYWSLSQGGFRYVMRLSYRIDRALCETIMVSVALMKFNIARSFDTSGIGVNSGIYTQLCCTDKW